MTTRIVYDTLLDITNQPQANKLVVFESADCNNNQGGIIIPSRTTTFTDENGYFEVELVNLTSTEAVYSVCLSSQAPFLFVLPEGTDPIQLSVLKECGGKNWTDPQFLATLNYIQENTQQFAFEVEVDLSTTYEQATPSTIWAVNHNLGKYPSVTAQDIDGAQLIGQVEYLDLNNLNFLLGSARVGTLYLN